MLVLHHDITSPAAAVAVLRLQRLADEGLPVAFSPLDVLGLEVAIPPTLELLDGLRRCTDAAAEHGLAMRRPSRQPPTLRAHAVGGVAERLGLGSAWRWRCLQGYWSDDLDLSDDAVLVALGVATGLDEVDVRSVLGDRAALQELRSRMANQRRRGVGGVPVLEVDGVFTSAHLGDEDLRQLATL
ncbi:MAG: DsbA family protein [Nitriliruptoraceae bacterium]